MCKYCDKLKEFIQEFEPLNVRTEEIHLDPRGFFEFKSPIKYCPNCGEEIKFKDSIYGVI